MKNLWRLLLCGIVGISAIAASGQRLRVGQMFPDFAAQDFQSQQKIARQDLNGHVVIVDFWASWCGPCKESFPFYSKLFAEKKEQGLIIIGVNVDDQLDDAKKFMQVNPAPYTVIYDEGRKLTKQVGVATMPSSYILDRKGKVMEIHKGFLNKKKDEIAREIDRLLTKK
jgi:thiol-disulfide isomerase/thioredoxin